MFEKNEKNFNFPQTLFLFEQNDPKPWHQLRTSEEEIRIVVCKKLPDFPQNLNDDDDKSWMLLPFMIITFPRKLRSSIAVIINHLLASPTLYYCSTITSVCRWLRQEKTFFPFNLSLNGSANLLFLLFYRITSEVTASKKCLTLTSERRDGWGCKYLNLKGVCQRMEKEEEKVTYT